MPLLGVLGAAQAELGARGGGWLAASATPGAWDTAGTENVGGKGAALLPSAPVENPLLALTKKCARIRREVRQSPQMCSRDPTRLDARAVDLTR